jgi:hypothetical protein
MSPIMHLGTNHTARLFRRVLLAFESLRRGKTFRLELTGLAKTDQSLWVLLSRETPGVCSPTRMGGRKDG